VDTEDLMNEALAEAELARLQRLATAHAREDMAWLMDHKQGRRIVWRLLERAGVYRSSFDESPVVAARNEGMRLAGVALMADAMDAGLEGYVQMLRENTEAPK
jgi:hypothetical protein